MARDTVVALDFETSNSAPGSACAIGLAFVEGDRVVRREHTLIRPRDMRFYAGNIRIHGIRPEDVEDAPEFPAVLQRFGDDLDGALVVAHNASFDLGVLRESAALYGLGVPAIRSFCTVAMARKIWPELPSRRLDVLAERFAIGFRHHDAGEDAYACAHIALRGMEEMGADDIPDLARRSGLLRRVAPTARRRADGIAARALQARGGAAPAELAFTVRGSKGTPYRIEIVGGTKGSPVRRLACSCPGHRFRQDCRHVRALLAGDFESLLPAGLAEMRALAEFLSREAMLGPVHGSAA